MRLSRLVVNLNLRVNDVACVETRNEKFLEDHCLHLEATDVLVIDHDREGFTEDLSEHVFVEVSGNLWQLLKYASHCMH